MFLCLMFFFGFGLSLVVVVVDYDTMYDYLLRRFSLEFELSFVHPIFGLFCCLCFCC